jgi:glutamate synthase (ferredoxin)
MPQRFHVDISNVNRCVGTMLGSEVTGKHAEGLPDETLTVDCTGSGGVSFGAFLPSGITLNIEGESNDFFGKGLSGGTVSVAPHHAATYRPEENVVVGNVAFYGATSGKGFVNGLAGQRFAVRNSGATLVVEGVGNNGCEYMTGGVVLVLGEVGLNFAAGMSGGVAYVYDAEHTLAERCNRDMVDLTAPDRDELAFIKRLIDEHVQRTESPLGVKLLYRFGDIASDFVKVIPREYAHMMELTAKLEASGLTHDEAVERAFELREANA